MEKKKYIKFIKNKREIGKIIIYLLIAIMLIFSMKTLAAAILSSSESVIADEKTTIRTAVAISRGASSNNKVEIESLTTELGKYASTEVIALSAERIQVEFERTGNIYEIDVNHGPIFDLLNESIPYLPLGYIPIEGTDLDKGFVIEDENGNQFVWVEVPKTTTVYQTAGLEIKNFTSEEFEKIENDLLTYTSVYRNGTAYTDIWSSEDSTGLTESEYNTLRKKMLKSIYKNGGFYVGRYETGTTTARTSAGAAATTPVIKQNEYPYNYITPTLAQTLSESFATSGYTSSLMFGVQWDLVLKYLETKGAATQSELITDSRPWGNFKANTFNVTDTNAKYYTVSIGGWTNSAYGYKASGEAVFLSLGASETFKKQNIYDLAGNMWEMTLEQTNEATKRAVIRGGNCSDNGGYTANYRVGSSTNVFQGFRVCLYKDEGIYIPDEENQPTYIPDGYTAIDGTMETGFVIADSLGNEYVWVEVPRTVAVYRTAGLSITTFTEDEFNLIENDLHTYTSAYRKDNYIDIWPSTERTGLTETEYYTLKKKMLKSIYKNGGFYIGRYETGIDYSQTPRTAEGETSQTPVIKQNAYPYSLVTSAQAQELSESFKTTGYETSLLFGVQWDLTLKYLESKGTPVGDLITNSTSWGNFRSTLYNLTDNNIKYTVDGVTWQSAPYNKTGAERIYLTTGASDAFKKQNIYDLAGGVWEWILEKNNISDPENVSALSYRGSSAWHDSTTNAEFINANCRSGYKAGIYRTSYDHGFRTCLYKDEGTSSYDAPAYIPYGYAHVPGTDMEKGFVIQDEQGNEYVWVEVPRTNSVYKAAGTGITLFTDSEFGDIEKDLYIYTTAYKTTGYEDKWSSIENTGLTESEYNIQKKKMLKSIYKNEGFYVGRYETGIDYSEGYRTGLGFTNQTPVIKQNAYPYNFVTTAQAQELSESFKTSGYEASLMFGVQWDLIMKYLETSGAATQGELITDSTSWGNYKNSIYEITNTSAKHLTSGGVWTDGTYNKTAEDSIILTTGASNIFEKQEIYELAGNCWERTLEFSGNAASPSVVRGGWNTVTYTAKSRTANSSSVGYSNGSFRVSLYKDEGIGITAAYSVEGYNGVSGTNLDNGKVIQDANGNQFVWVKVPRTITTYPTAGLDIESFSDAEYTEIENDLKAYSLDYSGEPVDQWYSEAAQGMTETEYNSLKKKMLKSVYLNGGFYVGRFETGTTTARTSETDAITTPVIRQNVYPYNFVSNVQAQELAESFSIDGYEASMMFDVQWDLIMKYLATSGNATDAELKTNSTEWGNYNNHLWNVTNTSSKYYTSSAGWKNGAYGNKTAAASVLLSTGASEDFKKQNIYDLVGNVMERTLGRGPDPSNYPMPAMGGSFQTDGGIRTAVSNNYNQQANYKTVSTGFRVTLFKDEGETLVRKYDASNLDGNGATGTSTTTIKDLTGTYDGTIYNSPTFGNGYISLNEGGSSNVQYIDMGPMLNLSAVTVNCKFSVSEIESGREQAIIANTQAGGFELFIGSNGKLGFAVRREDATSYEAAYATTNIELNTIYDVTGIYDGKTVYIYVNGVLEATTETAGGNIKNPTNGEPTTIGADPQGSVAVSDFLTKMKLYSAKIWTAPADRIFEFSIAGKTYKAEFGMTWEEWCNSAYNTIGFSCWGGGQVGTAYAKVSGGVTQNSLINVGGSYTLSGGGGSN